MIIMLILLKMSKKKKCIYHLKDFGLENLLIIIRHIGRGELPMCLIVVVLCDYASRVSVISLS